MTNYAALDVSLEATAVWVVVEEGRILAEKKIPTVLTRLLPRWPKPCLISLASGWKTGPLAVWLWNELCDKGLPIICMDARHANAALKVRPNKTRAYKVVGSM